VSQLRRCYRQRRHSLPPPPCLRCTRWDDTRIHTLLCIPYWQ